MTLIVQAALGNSWEGCITEKQKMEGEMGEINSSLVIKDQETAVCLTIAIDEGDWANPTEYKRFSFAPQADDYSRFVVEDCKSIFTGPAQARSVLCLLAIPFKSWFTYLFTNRSNNNSQHFRL